MKLTEIKFKDWMIDFIPQGEKTVTRRIAKQQPVKDDLLWTLGGAGWSTDWVAPVLGHSLAEFSPYGLPSDLLKVEGRDIYMIIQSVTLERLHSITPEEAVKEGCAPYGIFDEFRGSPHPTPGMFWRAYKNPVDAFKNVWESIYGDDSWKANPWVWRYEFRYLTEGEAEFYLRTRVRLPEINQVVWAMCENHKGVRESRFVKRIKTKDTAQGWQWSDFEINSYLNLKVLSWEFDPPVWRVSCICGKARMLSVINPNDKNSLINDELARLQGKGCKVEAIPLSQARKAELCFECKI